MFIGLSEELIMCQHVIKFSPEFLKSKLIIISIIANSIRLMKLPLFFGPMCSIFRSDGGSDKKACGLDVVISYRDVTARMAIWDQQLVWSSCNGPCSWEIIQGHIYLHFVAYVIMAIT